MPPAYEILLLNTAIPQIQAAQSGDTYVVPRDIAFSAALTLSAGTANGVPYLNGSKVLTSGSALTFDGTNFATTGTITSGGSYNFNTTAGRDILWGTGSYTYITGNPTTGVMAFGIASTELMRLTSTGLGIGTSSPVAKLDVYKTATVSTTDPVAANVPSIQARATTASGKAMLQLTALSAGAAVAPIYIEAGAVADYRSYMNLVYSGDGSGAGYFAVSQFSPAGSSTTERMRITSAGNFGVGTTSPIAFSNQTSVTVNGTNTGRFDLEVNETHTGALVATSTYVDLSAITNIPITFGTNSTERARITSGGAFLVGTTTSSDYRMRVDAAASNHAGVFVGPTASYASLQVVNTAGSGTRGLISFRTSVGGTETGSITTDGTNTAYNTSSDYRLKDNQQPLAGSGDFIDALRPKMWNWKSNGSRGVGFIAHEVQAVSPGSVVGEKDAVDADGKPIMQAMEYGSAEFIANIIAELQSLRARVAQLEAK